MNEEFYSQFGEDKWLVDNKILPVKGFFLDIGAGHYRNLSNTFYFEKNGWEGICVDADVRQLPGLIEHRKNVVIGAINTWDGIMPFYMNLDTPDISRKDPQGNEQLTHVACFKINHLIIPNKVDLLSLDIEGMEASILEQMFYYDIFPDVIIVEYVTSGINNADAVEAAFIERPYKKIHITPANFIYKKI